MSSTALIRDRIVACFLGKAVGGTLGMPKEGHDGPFDLTFYDPPCPPVVPNDDLDLQVLWACVLDQMNPVQVDRRVLGQAWLDQCALPVGRVRHRDPQPAYGPATAADRAVR